MNASRRAALLLLAASPLLAQAAEPAPKRLLLFWPHYEEILENLREIVRELAARGWREGPLLAVSELVSRYESQTPQELAKIAVAMRPDVIVTEGTQATQALMQATDTIPIVASVADPVGSGFARSLQAPGRNFTGTSQGIAEAALKLAELLVDLVPGIRRVALVDPFPPALQRLYAHNDAAFRAKGLEVIRFRPMDGDGAAATFAALKTKGAQAIHVGAVAGDIVPVLAREAIRLGIPLLCKGEGSVAAGLLACVENDPAEAVARLAGQIERILGGASPARTPIQFPQRFRVAVNRRTSDALGLRIPPHVLLRADRVIE